MTAARCRRCFPAPASTACRPRAASPSTAVSLRRSPDAQISGLESLKSLTNLSLFSNRITRLTGLDSLAKLQLLSVGNNLLANLECVMYLRPFRELQAVNFVGNPFCQEVEYRNYVLAHLKYLKYAWSSEPAPRSDALAHCLPPSRRL